MILARIMTTKGSKPRLERASQYIYQCEPCERDEVKDKKEKGREKKSDTLNNVIDDALFSYTRRASQPESSSGTIALSLSLTCFEKCVLYLHYILLMSFFCRTRNACPFLHRKNNP